VIRRISSIAIGIRAPRFTMRVLYHIGRATRRAALHERTPAIG